MDSLTSSAIVYLFILLYFNLFVNEFVRSGEILENFAFATLRNRRLLIFKEVSFNPTINPAISPIKCGSRRIFVYLGTYICGIVLMINNFEIAVSCFKSWFIIFYEKDLASVAHEVIICKAVFFSNK